jgi:hypothetical protein
MTQPHNPIKTVMPEGDHWRYTVTCDGTGCNGDVIDMGTKPTEHEAQAAALTISGMHKLG